MKKKLAIKFATLMVIATNATVDVMRAPNSFFLWGEPTLPEKPNK